MFIDTLRLYKRMVVPFQIEAKKHTIEITKTIQQLYRLEKIYLLLDKSDAIHCIDTRRPIEIVSVTCCQDYKMLVLALKMFFHYTKSSWNVTILDDGSLVERDLAFIRKHCFGAKIISLTESKSLLAKQFSPNHPFVKYAHVPYVLKKAASCCLTSKPNIINLDSDILFFHEPREIIEWANRCDSILYLQDSIDGYIYSDVEAKSLFNVTHLPRLNSGLLCYPKEILDINLLERMVDHIFTNCSTRHIPWIQSFFSLTFNLQKNYPIKALSSSYTVSPPLNQDEVANYTCIHYTSPFRYLYYDAVMASEFLNKV